MEPTLKYLFVTILLLVTVPSFAQCDLKSAALRADYQLNYYENEQLSGQSNIILWRHGNTVAHQYPQTAITESWYLSKNQQIKPTRFFDQYQRAIEYQPGETIHGKSEKDWSYRYQLVSNSLLSKMTLQRESGQGCKRSQVFTKKTKNSTIELTWLPEQQLLTHFSWKKGPISEEWQLIKLEHNSQIISAFFTRLDQYKSTDYADIGDDHSDPFLTNMVNLGFIEHGASGFYDTEGKTLEGHEH